MKIKQLIEELCSRLQSNLNIRQDGLALHTVELVQYNRMVYDNTKEYITEIRVDGKCVVKDSYQVNPYLENTFFPEHRRECVEEQIMQHMLTEIFSYGVMSAKDFLDKQYKQSVTQQIPAAHQGLHFD